MIVQSCYYLWFLPQVSWICFSTEAGYVLITKLMENTHPVCTPFCAVVLLAVVVLKRQFFPYLHSSIVILLCYLPGCSAVLVLDCRSKYYFIGNCDENGQKKKTLSWIPEELWKKRWSPCESLVHLPLPKLSDVCKVVGLYLDFMGCLRQIKTKDSSNNQRKQLVSYCCMKCTLHPNFRADGSMQYFKTTFIRVLLLSQVHSHWFVGWRLPSQIYLYH